MLSRLWKFFCQSEYALLLLSAVNIQGIYLMKFTTILHQLWEGWKGQARFPTCWTAHDSVILTRLVAHGLIQTLSHLVQQTSGTSHNGLWSVWPSYTWEQPGPLPNPVSRLTSWNPEAPAWKNKRLTLPLSPHKPCAFSFKNPIPASPWGCSLIPTQPTCKCSIK